MTAFDSDDKWFEGATLEEIEARKAQGLTATDIQFIRFVTPEELEEIDKRAEARYSLPNNEHEEAP